MAFGDFTVDRNSTKYVLGSGGTIIPSATDEPAFEFNADGSYKGLLVEPAATNLCLRSEDFSNAVWVKSGSSPLTVTQNVITAPDGLLTADKIVEPDATSGYYIRQNISGLTLPFVFSIYVKAAELDKIVIGNDNGTPRAYFDLASETVTNHGGAVGTLTPIANGWYLCKALFPVGISGANTYVSFSPVRSDVSIFSTKTGDGTSGVYVWGAQLETGPIATSYIPTTTAQVTRNKDDITQTSASSLIGQTEGTLYLEVDWRLASGTEQYLLSVNDGTNSNRMLIYNSSGVLLQIYVEAGGAFIAGGGESSSAYSGIQKFAFAYADGDFELYRNGSSISSTGGSLASLGTLTDIDLGQSYSALQQANMHIRAVALYPTRLGAVELEVLTGAPTYGSYALMASSLGYTVE